MHEVYAPIVPIIVPQKKKKNTIGLSAAITFKNYESI